MLSVSIFSNQGITPVDGNYAEQVTGEGAVHVSHGYSRDHRPDFKQVVLELINPTVTAQSQRGRAQTFRYFVSSALLL